MWFLALTRWCSTAREMDSVKRSEIPHLPWRNLSSNELGVAVFGANQIRVKMTHLCNDKKKTKTMQIQYHHYTVVYHYCGILLYTTILYTVVYNSIPQHHYVLWPVSSTGSCCFPQNCGVTLSHHNCSHITSSDSFGWTSNITTHRKGTGFTLQSPNKFT